MAHEGINRGLLDGVNLADSLKPMPDGLSFQHENMFPLPAPQHLPDPIRAFQSETTPHDIISLRKALDVNRTYQNLVKEQLKRIDKAREQNMNFRNKLATGQLKGPVTRRPEGSVSRSPLDSYFTDSTGEKPLENADATVRRERSKGMAVAHKFRKWNKTEQTNLKTGVLQSIQRGMVEALMKDFETSDRQLDSFHEQVMEIRRLSESETFIRLELVDWDWVARNAVQTRTALDCRLQWTNCDNPRISHADWTRDEDKALKELAAKHRGHNWELIATELGTGRVAHQCITRYQKRLNTALKKSKWVEADDAILLEAVRRYGEKNWQQVASCLEGRTAQQCLHRYKKALDPKIRRGKWSEQEDKMLEKAVQTYGCRNWSKIQQHVPGRTDVQCRERWMNVLNPELNNGPWSAEEDEKLRLAIQVHGLGKWSQVAVDLYPRTDNQCWRRWKTINAGEAVDYRANVLKRKLGLPESEPKRVRPPAARLPLPPQADPSALPAPAGPELEPAPVAAHAFGEEPLAQASLPLVFPSPVTFTALYRLLQTLEAESNRAQFPSASCLDHIQSPDFQLLASWFNSLFLYPLLVVFTGMVQEREQHPDPQ